VPLVVHVKPVVDGVILQVGHVTGNIDGSHSERSLGRRGGHSHTHAQAQIDTRITRRAGRPMCSPLW
jgi:hypothetical protein